MMGLECGVGALEALKHWDTTDAVHPDVLPRVIVAWTHAFTTGVPYEFEHRLAALTACSAARSDVRR